MFFKKIRLSLLIVSAFIKKETKLLVISGVVGIAIFLLIIKVVPYIPRPKPTDKIGVVGNYTFENLPIEILTKASSGLTKIDDDGLPISSLAEDWEISEDGKTYTFWLQDNIFWQDGNPIKASDINYNLPDVKVEVVDDKTIKYTLEESFSPFPGLLSTPVFKDGHIGTGRFEVKKIDNNGPYIKKLLLVGPDKNILYFFYSTENVAFWAFKSGEINQMPNTFSNPFEKEWWEHIVIEENIKEDYYIGLFLNTNDKYLSDKNLRQALAYATLKPDDETRAVGPINPNSWAYNPDVKQYNANAAQAEKLFSKFKKEYDIDELTIRIDTTSTFLLMAEQIKNNWKEVLDINTEIALIDEITSDFQALLIISQIPDDPDQYTFWHSTQETNITSYKSPKVDKILEDGRRITDVAERNEKYLDFQKFLLEDSPVIFISHPIVLTIKRKALSLF